MASRNRDNTNITVSSAGAINYPSQPAFFAYLNATQNDVTGDGTVYTLAFPVEIYDQANNFDGTSTFTAPVTGLYSFTVGLAIGTINSRTLLWQAIGTSRTVTLASFTNVAAGQNSLILNSQFYLDMAASDTLYLTIMASGGLKQSDIATGTSTDQRTYFSGKLVV